MSFKELLKKYKDGTATPEEIKSVEYELSKFEALNDFEYESMAREMGILDSSEKSAPDYTGGEKTNAGTNSLVYDSEQFSKTIQKEIKRTFTRIGMCIGASVLVIVLFLMFELSPLMNAMYYNPTEPMWEESETNYPADRLTVDMSTYTELLIPHKKYDSVYAVSRGFGKYYFTANKTAWRPLAEDNASVAGQIDKNTMQIFTPDLLEVPCFDAMGLSPLWDNDMAMCGYLPEEAEEDIKSLTAKRPQEAYVTFSRDLTYAECEALTAKYEIYDPWYGVRLSDGLTGYGFADSTDGMVYYGNTLNDTYPDLLHTFHNEKCEGDSEDVRVREKYFKNHFVSMVKYIAEQDEFLEMMDANNIPAGKIEKYINKHGLKIYGMAVYADKEVLLELCEDDNVYGVLLADEI